MRIVSPDFAPANNQPGWLTAGNHLKPEAGAAIPGKVNQHILPIYILISDMSGAYGEFVFALEPARAPQSGGRGGRFEMAARKGSLDPDGAAGPMPSAPCNHGR